MVIGSLISGFVFYNFIVYWEMLTAILSAQLWVLFVIFNTVAILPKVTAYEGFYAALAVQTDLTLISAWCMGPK